MPALPPERPGCPKAPGGRRPLPDPAAVRLCLVPDSAPPYDDEVSVVEPPGRGEGTADSARSAAGATVTPDTGTPGTAATATAAATAAAPAPRRPATGGPPTGGPGTGGSAAGAPSGWQSRFAQVLAETLAGSRPPRQIAPWTTQQAREHIQRLGPRMASVQRPRVRRVVTFHPASDVMEMAVVVGFGPRVRALAVRLERSATCPPADSATHPAAAREVPVGRWVCTAVEAA
jgi:hypothetical protein